MLVEILCCDRIISSDLRLPKTIRTAYRFLRTLWADKPHRCFWTPNVSGLLSTFTVNSRGFISATPPVEFLLTPPAMRRLSWISVLVWLNRMVSAIEMSVDDPGMCPATYTATLLHEH